jgi:hypothetical protein
VGLKAAQAKRVVAIVSFAVFTGVAGYWWAQERLWTIEDAGGQKRCRVIRGWSEQDVAATCGKADGRGTQIKVFESEGWRPLARACSAPGDVYGGKVVLYDCDGKVRYVERMPVGQFVYPDPASGNDVP